MLPNSADCPSVSTRSLPMMNSPLGTKIIPAGALLQPRIKIYEARSINLTIPSAPEAKASHFGIGIKEAPVESGPAEPATVKGTVLPGSSLGHLVFVAIVFCDMGVIGMGKVPALGPFPDIACH